MGISGVFFSASYIAIACMPEQVKPGHILVILSKNKKEPDCCFACSYQTNKNVVDNM